MKVQQNEGCDVYGYLEVNKVAGNFHFAPGKSFQQQHVHGNFIEKCLHIMFVSFVSLARWVPLVKQKLPIRSGTPSIFSGVRVTQSLVFSAVFCRALFILFLLSIVLCRSSIYRI